MGIAASLAFSNQGAGRVGATTEPLVTAVQGSFPKPSERLWLHGKSSCSKRLQSLKSLLSEQDREISFSFFSALKTAGESVCWCLARDCEEVAT